MNKIYVFVALCFLFFSCDNNSTNLTSKPICFVENPTDDLAWLKNEIAEREQNITEFSKYLYIMQSMHNEGAIFIYANCDPLINSVSPVYNCDGEFIGIIGNRSEDIPFEALSKGQIIWKTNDFACDF